MTPAEIEKEAERIFAEIVSDIGMARVHSSQIIPQIIKALRAVHDASMKEAGKFAGDSAKEMYIEGFNDGVEKILRIGDDNHPEFKDIHPQLRWFLEKIRALKLSSEAGGNE